VPKAGVDYLDEATAKSQGANYLIDEIKKRAGSRGVGLKVQVQLANVGDVVDDATNVWPDDRRLFDLGQIELNGLVPNDAHEQKTVIFDPIPRVDGIEPSNDPPLELRAAFYLISGRRRRQAPEV